MSFKILCELDSQRICLCAVRVSMLNMCWKSMHKLLDFCFYGLFNLCSFLPNINALWKKWILLKLCICQFLCNLWTRRQRTTNLHKLHLSVCTFFRELLKFLPNKLHSRWFIRCQEVCSITTIYSLPQTNVTLQSASTFPNVISGSIHRTWSFVLLYYKSALSIYLSHRLFTEFTGSNGHNIHLLLIILHFNSIHRGVHKLKSLPSFIHVMWCFVFELHSHHFYLRSLGSTYYLFEGC